MSNAGTLPPVERVGHLDSGQASREVPMAEQVCSFNSAKMAITTWWILIILAIVLWYRGMKTDHVMAAFIAILAVIQLIIYGVRSGVSPQSGGRLINICLWLSVAVLAAATYIYTKAVIAGILTVIFGVVFIISIVASTQRNYTKAGAPDTIAGQLGIFGWLFAFGLLASLLILGWSEGFKSIGLWILTAYLVIAIIAVATTAKSSISGMFTAATVGFTFLVWMVGYIGSTRKRC
jgi:hypothetical protein